MILLFSDIIARYYSCEIFNEATLPRMENLQDRGYLLLIKKTYLYKEPSNSKFTFYDILKTYLVAFKSAKLPFYELWVFKTLLTNQMCRASFLLVTNTKFKVRK